MHLVSRASDYALLLLTYLAKLGPEGSANVKKISVHYNLSVRFLANIANKLSIARILISHRGIGGGIRLAKPGSQISIREVMEVVDGPIQAMFCQNTEEECSHEMSCLMKSFWDDVQGTIMNKLNKTTINDLVTVGNNQTPQRLAV